uniref:NB-ARC domain-containing protein n=1 Tax=Oryza brachyantha TaxID=4533 RepID=J3N058_ORYBR
MCLRVSCPDVVFMGIPLPVDNQRSAAHAHDVLDEMPFPGFPRCSKIGCDVFKKRLRMEYERCVPFKSSSTPAGCQCRSLEGFPELLCEAGSRTQPPFFHRPAKVTWQLEWDRNPASPSSSYHVRVAAGDEQTAIRAFGGWKMKILIPCSSQHIWRLEEPRRAAVMDTVQWICSTGTNIHEAIQLSEELSRLRAALPKARLLINRGEWGRFKNKELGVLSQLKDTTYDAEDLLREFDDQVLRQKIEDAGRSWAGQLFSSSLNLAKSLICGSKKRIMEVQDKLDRAVADLEREVNPLRLHFENVQHMPETSSVIGASQVFGRDEERDLVIEKLGVMIGRDDERDLVIEKLGVPLTRYGAARPKGKRVTVVTGAKSAPALKRLKGESSRAGPGLSEATKCIGNVSVLPIFGIGGVGKTTLAQYIYNDERVQAHFDKRIWVCVSDLFDKKRITEEIFRSITKKDSSQHNFNDI